MGKTYYEIDVFGAEPFSGNPVGVVFEANELSTKQMQDFARWTNLSETTFVLTPNDNEADYGLMLVIPHWALLKHGLIMRAPLVKVK